MLQNRYKLKNKALNFHILKVMLKNTILSLRIKNTTKLNSIYLFLKNDANDFP